MGEDSGSEASGSEGGDYNDDGSDEVIKEVERQMDENEADIESNQEAKAQDMERDQDEARANLELEADNDQAQSLDDEQITELETDKQHAKLQDDEEAEGVQLAATVDDEEETRMRQEEKDAEEGVGQDGMEDFEAEPSESPRFKESGHSTISSGTPTSPKDAGLPSRALKPYASPDGRITIEDAVHFLQEQDLGDKGTGAQ